MARSRWRMTRCAARITRSRSATRSSTIPKEDVSVVELSWTETTPLSRIYRAGSHGAKTQAAGLSLAELSGFELVQTMARRGQWSATDQACREAYGKPAPARPQAVKAEGALLIWSGPDQFLVLSPRAGGSAGM